MRTCTICTHQELAAIDQALVERSASYRTLADRFGLSQTALKRHAAQHLPATMLKASAAVEVVRGDDLIAKVRNLEARAMSLLDTAEGEGDVRAACAALREAREAVKLLAQMACAEHEHRKRAEKGGGGLTEEAVREIQQKILGLD